jgi:nucleoside-diphosphate-sugar epimerase
VRALVLGGSVFVGRRLVEALVRSGDEVTVLNRGRTPSELPAAVDRLTADRTDPASMHAALHGTEWDAVFDVSGFVMAAGGSDIAGLLDLLDGAVGNYVYVSSIMAYDQSMVVPVTEPPTPWTEDLPTNPDGGGTYGGFKALAEREMLDRHEATGFPATILRPAAIYGPHNNIFDMETPMFLRLLRHLPILLPHDGLVTGSYGHVDDLCDLAVAAATSAGAVGEVVNATGAAVSSEGYVRTLADVVGEDPDIVMVPEGAGADSDAPLWSHLFDARHHAVLDTTKAASLLGASPRFDTATGHADAYEWFLSRGGAAIDEAEIDPVWRATWDFGVEARLAATER